MVYVFLADGFEETEAIAPIDMLRRAGADVKTVGIGKKSITSSHSITVEADISEEEAKLSDELEMIIFPGGKLGTETLDASKTVHAAIDFCVKNGVKIGAICAAPSILGKLDLLDGRKATSFPSFREFLNGAQIVEGVVTDGIFTTAAGAGVSVEFGLELVKVLKGAETSEKIRSQIQCAK